MYCTQCGMKMEHTFKFCGSCGAPRAVIDRKRSESVDNGNEEDDRSVDRAQDPVGERGEDHGEKESTSERDVRSEMSDSDEHEDLSARKDADADTKAKLPHFVGTRVDVYRAKWENESRWNWAAFLFDVYWLLYRKMYLYALLTVIIANVVGFIVWEVLKPLNIMLALATPLYIYVLMKFVLARAGNAMYYRHAMNKIRAHQHTNQPSDKLAMAGGVNLAFPLLLALPFIITSAGWVRDVWNSNEELRFSFTRSATVSSSGKAISGGEAWDEWSELARSINGHNWQELIGYDRLTVFVGAILDHWRDHNTKLPKYERNLQRTAEVELWTMMLLEYYAEPAYRNHNLIAAMDAVRLLLLTNDPSEAQGRKHTSNPTERLGTPFSQEAELIEAVTQKDADRVRKLLSDGVNPNLRTHSNSTLLIDSAFSGRTEIVSLLLEAGADISLLDDFSRNALLAAVSGAANWNGTGEIHKSEEAALSITRQLLEHGADPNSRFPLRESSGMTALMIASSDFPQVAKLLLEYGADPNQVDSAGDNALMHTLHEPSVFQAMLDHGADPWHVNNTGESAYDRVKNGNSVELAALLDISIEYSPVFPYHPEVERIIGVIEEGMSKADAVERFGDRYEERWDELDGTELYWMYVFDANGETQIGFESGDVNLQGLANGRMTSQLYITWKIDSDVAERCTIYVKGIDTNEVYEYRFLPGEKDVTGRSIFQG